MAAKATAILVPMAGPRVWRRWVVFETFTTQIFAVKIRVGFLEIYNSELLSFFLNITTLKKDTR